MGRVMQLLGREEPEAYKPICADSELFEEIREELPQEPMIQLQPRKDNPGLEAGAPLCRALYHYRKDKFGRNASPVNSFEIWFDEGEIRFYFHPDTREQKNSGMKHFEDKHPGTKMTEESDPFPQINKGDYISGARMTLTHHFARPLRMVEGPNSFNRDPFGDLISDMVVEGERTRDGDRVRSEDVRMVVQCIFKPADRGVSRGGLFGTDFTDYADNLKKPRQKTGWDQTARMIFGLDPEEQAPTAKQKKTAKIISELRGEPEFFFRLRILCISPYAEMAKQHTERVCEVFESFYNPTTEQGFQTLPIEESSLRHMLTNAASRGLSYSSFDKMFSGKDVVSIPELAGLVHLPNGDIEAPEINWTTMAKGAGVPTNTADLNEVDERLQEEVEKSGQDEEADNQDDSRMQEFSMDQVEDMQDEGEDLSISKNEDPNEVVERRASIGGDAETEKMKVDKYISEDSSRAQNPTSSDGSDTRSGEETFDLDGTTDEEDILEEEDNSGGSFLSRLGLGADDDSTEEQSGRDVDPHPSQEQEPDRVEETETHTETQHYQEAPAGEGDSSTDDELDDIVMDWEEELQKKNQTIQNSNSSETDSQEGGQQTDEPAQGEREEQENEENTEQNNVPQTQDDLPDAVLEDLEN